MSLIKKDSPYPHWQFKPPNSQDRLRIVPERGGLITEWRVAGREILYFDHERFADKNLSVRGGIPLLFPICGNLSNDSYKLGDKEFTLPQHGFARDQIWDIRPLDNTYGFVLSLSDNRQIFDLYPFSFFIEIEVNVRSNELDFRIIVTNYSKRAMPFSFGLHPYFNVFDLTKIKIEGLPDKCNNQLVMRSEPTEKQLAVIDKGVDFIAGPSKSVVINDFESGKKLVLEHYHPMDLTVIWTDPPRSMICLEPWTSPRNALVSGDRIISLETGESKTLKCKFYLDSQT